GGNQQLRCNTITLAPIFVNTKINRRWFKNQMYRKQVKMTKILGKNMEDVPWAKEDFLKQAS
ncbi:hypothetical protein, partial [Streptococcus pneumoniae]